MLKQNKLFFLVDYEPEFDFILRDSFIYKMLLDKSPEKYSYVTLKDRDFYREDGTQKCAADFPEEFKSAIPIGSIMFIESYLKIFVGMDHEPPIEIPECFLEWEFLKRSYMICTSDKLPHTGKFFIKDITRQKQFSFMGAMQDFFRAPTDDFDPTHLFAVSEYVEILSEYRVYVIDGKIVNMVCYKGSVEAFPNPAFLKKVVALFIREFGLLTSFSFDVMVTDRGTALIEIHSYLSLGLYVNLWNESLIKAYCENWNSIILRNRKKI